MNEFLKPIQEKRKMYEENPELVKEILDNGTKKAQEKARETMKKVRTPHAKKMQNFIVKSFFLFFSLDSVLSA